MTTEHGRHYQNDMVKDAVSVNEKAIIYVFNRDVKHHYFINSLNLSLLT